MIIDCHTHLGRNEHITGSASQLISSMDQAQIDKALVFAGGINNCPNDWMLDQIAPYAGRLYGVAAYRRKDDHNLFVTKKEVQRFASWYQSGRIAAVKFYTGYDHYYPIDVNWELGMLEDVKCPVIFHSGDCLSSFCAAKLKYAHPLHIDEIAVNHPKLNIVIAHMGFPWHRDAAEVCYKNDNVYADVSGFVYGDFNASSYAKFSKVMKEFTDICDGEKLIFGTDWPIANQSSYVNALQVSDELTPHQMTKTARRVFKFDEVKTNYATEYFH